MSLEILNETFGGLKIDAECVKATTHRHFAFYDVKLGSKCRLSQLERFSREIALKLQSKTDPVFKIVRDEGLVRLQVVVSEPESLPLLPLLQSETMGAGSLPFLLGETDDGKVLWNDMSQNPHMLIAGSPGSGKSVLLHNMIANSIHRKDVRLFLVDPKGVEFVAYDDPKIKTVSQVVYDYDSTLEMLQFLTQLMEDRYEFLRKLGQQSVESLPGVFRRYLLIIDEVSDLMMQDGKEHKFESALIKLAQKSRAAGIHIVLATQHPSVKVVTGLIKANFEARLACKVSTRSDSQVVLDHPGAERLMGKGDAILRNKMHDMVRFQVAYTDSNSILEIVK